MSTLMEAIIAALAWPTAVLIIALVAIVVFRGQIASLIGRTRKVGRGGLETYDAQPAQPTEEKKGVDEFSRSCDNPLIVDAEALILKDLKDRKIDGPPDRERALVRALAASNIIQHFERVHGAIWGIGNERCRHRSMMDTSRICRITTACSGRRYAPPVKPRVMRTERCSLALSSRSSLWTPSLG
jgi:hypothetical protein